jgi:hypothetical protein
MAMSRANMNQEITKPGKVGKVMREFKEGTLHSGKNGPVVREDDMEPMEYRKGGRIDGCAMRGKTKGTYR